MNTWKKKMLLVGCMGLGLITGGRAAVWDLAAIQHEPLNAEITERDVVDGVVYETVVYTSREVDGEPERITGIFVYPEGGDRLPGVFWSQNGMAPANRYFPGIFARKGYACMVVTLPVQMRNGYNGTFDTTNPAEANLVLLARDQMRGITYMTQRSEVDPDRLAMAGSSYGGLFASVIAGVDPRIKAGVSFFAGGHHARGTNLQQFNRMHTQEDVEIWNRTFDAAFHLKNRDIPFMWGVAFNDHWFHFPAVAGTFEDMTGSGKRIVIAPHWQHAFSSDVDDTLLDFLDTVFMESPAYVAPGGLRVIVEDDTVVAEFSWEGERTVKKAELVVSYGVNLPWLGWSRRAAFVHPAEIKGNVARARLPILSPRVPLVLWGTVTDTRNVLTSTGPHYLETDKLATLPLSATPQLNAFPDGDFGDGILDMFSRMGEPLNGVADQEVKYSGVQSLRIDPPAQVESPAKPFVIRYLHWVPGLAHRFHLQVRAAEGVELTIRLTPVRPPNWRSPLVRELAAEFGWSALVDKWDLPVLPVEQKVTVGQQWHPVTMELPVPDGPVEGWSLEIHHDGTARKPYWIDDLKMVPLEM